MKVKKWIHYKDGYFYYVQKIDALRFLCWIGKKDSNNKKQINFLDNWYWHRQGYNKAIKGIKKDIRNIIESKKYDNN